MCTVAIFRPYGKNGTILNKLFTLDSAIEAVNDEKDRYITDTRFEIYYDGKVIYKIKSGQTTGRFIQSQYAI
jgi:hypothetical protein